MNLPPLRPKVLIVSIMVVGALLCGTLALGRRTFAKPHPALVAQANPPPIAPASGKLTVYCSVDQETAQGVLDEYRLRTKSEVQVIFDSEAGKTTGLINKIVEESKAGKPRCDVLWSGELFNTIRLARMGLLHPYDSAAGRDLPARFKDANHLWHATSARARVLAFDRARTALADVPLKWADIGQEMSRPTAIAHPLFGTTRGHVAAMFALWGKDKGREYLTRLRDSGAEVVTSNSTSARWVGTGKVELGFTDSDDCKLGVLRGMRNLDFVIPDMGDGGGLMIPCSIAIIKGSTNLPAAQQLVDHLLSEGVEVVLYESPAGHWPVREKIRQMMNIEWPAETKLPFDKIVDAMDDSEAAVREILIK